MFFRKRRISEVNVAIPRDELIRRSRILVIDDERPDLIEDLKNAGFSVDYEPDIDKASIVKLERSTYDLILLDFADVGRTIGPEQGLSLLRHIKRVNPSVVIFTYTSRALGTEHAEFYRAADGVLKKDAGIAESMETVEDGLRKAHDPARLWAGFLSLAGVPAGSDRDLDWQNKIVKGLKSESKLRSFKQELAEVLTSEEAVKAVLGLLPKLIASLLG